ncbi:hypothetical protein PR048_033078, partial [Dryococelus australis]
MRVQEAVDGMASHNVVDKDNIQNCAFGTEGYAESLLGCRGCDSRVFSKLCSRRQYVKHVFDKFSHQKQDGCSLYDNARPHISYHTIEEIFKIGWASCT